MTKYLSFIIIAFNLIFISCTDSKDGPTVVINAEDTFGGELMSPTITPFSVSFDNNANDNLTYYVSKNKESLEKIISEMVKNILLYILMTIRMLLLDIRLMINFMRPFTG